MSLDDLDEQIGEKSSKKKYLTWGIIAIIIIAAIAIPVACMRQSEPTEPAELTTIEQLETEIDALTDTVGGLETKIALHAEDIANFVAGDCTCPDYSGQFQNINNDLILLRTDLNAVPDYAVNFTQVNTELDALSTDLTAVEATLLGLQEQVNAIEVTDWTLAIDDINTDITSLGIRLDGVEGDITTLGEQIASAEADIMSLLTGLEDRIEDLEGVEPSPYAIVTELETNYLEVEVYGVGSNLVVVTLYGDELGAGGVYVAGSGYTIDGSFLYATARVLAIFLESDDVGGWTDGDIIELLVTEGSISYASASVGA